MTELDLSSELVVISGAAGGLGRLVLWSPGGSRGRRRRRGPH